MYSPVIASCIASLICSVAVQRSTTRKRCCLRFSLLLFLSFMLNALEQLHTVRFSSEDGVERQSPQLSWFFLNVF